MMALLSKLRTAITNPERGRNFAFGMLNYWPVHRLERTELIDMPVYCISLPTARRRRDLMARQARKAGLARFTFVDAIDGRDHDLDHFAESGDYDPVEASRHHDRGLTVGEIATTLSHGRAYDAIVRAGHARALVLEDDALFVTRRLSEIDFSDVPKDCEVLFLNSFIRDDPPRDHVAGSVYGTRSWYGSAAAYLLTRDAARKLAGVYRPVIHASDGLLGRSLLSLGEDNQDFRGKGSRITLNAYLVHPPPFLNGSTVGFTGTLLDT